MKKNLLAIFSAIFFALFSNNAKAEFYIGVDVLGSKGLLKVPKSDHPLPNSTDPNHPNVNITQDQKNTMNSLGGGINLGYRWRVGSMFFGPEIFYENFNFKNNVNFKSPNGLVTRNATLKLQERSGAKLNVGVQLSNQIDWFVSAGYADNTVQLSVLGLAYNEQVQDLKVTNGPILGTGFVYNITKDWGLKMAYDYQKITIKSANITGEGYVYKTDYQLTESTLNMHTIKFGILYNF